MIKAVQRFSLALITLMKSPLLHRGCLCTKEPYVGPNNMESWKFWRSLLYLGLSWIKIMNRSLHRVIFNLTLLFADFKVCVLSEKCMQSLVKI